MLTKNLKSLYLLILVSLVIACSGDDEASPDETGGDPTPTPDTNPANGSCEEGKTAVYIEKDGLLVIESENGSFSDTDWTLTTDITEFSGDGYLVWNGENSLGQPGNGTLTYKVRITKTGTYRFIWRSYITIGSNGSEHNDSWLRIPDAKHFYGRKNNGNIVYPKGTTLDPIPESAGQQNTTPNGSGKDGWFKIYMNMANKWHWQSSTSDNDAHNIFVVFDTPGDYTIEVSGRSEGHGIDKFVLFTEDITQNDATGNDTKSEIQCE